MALHYEKLLMVYTVARLYSSILAADTGNGCPSQVNLGNLTGEALYGRIIRIHANSSYDVAVATRLNEGVTAVQNGSLDILRKFSRSGGITISIAYGLMANNDTKECLGNAKMIAGAIAGVVAHRNDVISPPITGEAALQCLVKQKGEAAFTILAVGNSAPSSPYPGPNLSLLTALVKSITRIRKVAANNDTTAECTSAISDLGRASLVLVRIDHSDEEIKKAYGLNVPTAKKI